MTPVSVVVTVRDEAASIHALLSSLAQQTRPPDEVVIVDGGSTDGTLEILQQGEAADARLRVFSEPGLNISEGRNAAIRRAQHELILVTDAGVALPAHWVEHLAAPLEEDPTLAMVGGFFASAPESVFEWALGATILPLEDEIDPARFMPSHRSVAYRRSVWESLGGYPEWLDYCEDLLFDMRLREAGYRVAFEPRATVAFRPRSSVRAFALQYFRYARGDGKAGILGARHLIRYGVYSGALVMLVLATRAPALRGGLWLMTAIFGAAYCRRPWLRLLRTRAGRGFADLAAALVLVPLLRLTGDVAKMAGFPIGLLHAQRFGIPDWQEAHRAGS